jgi:cytochrome P450
LQANGEDPDTGLSDKELRDTVLTLLLAGHETTANALSWSFTLLAQHERVSQKLQQELDHVLHDDDPNAETLRQLKYTQQVFAETIRLYPSIWIMERRVVNDDRIAGISIPAGSTVLISPYTLHRHPAFWEDPEDFRPDRFVNDAETPANRPAYIPFGAGPHLCIGQAMAQLVARLVLAMAWRRFRLTLIEDQDLSLKPGITLRHGTPVWMRIESR